MTALLCCFYTIDNTVLSPKQSETVSLYLHHWEHLNIWSPVYAYFKILSKDSASGQTNSCYHAEKERKWADNVNVTLKISVEAKTSHESMFLETIWGWHKRLHEAATGFAHSPFWGQRWKKKNQKHTGQQKAVCCLEHRNEHPCCQGSWETAAALSHYCALPQRRHGGWDGAEPHTGHRGCNKSQMCWGDMKIHGQAPLKLLSMSTLRRLRYLKNVSMNRKITTS